MPRDPPSSAIDGASPAAEGPQPRSGQTTDQGYTQQYDDRGHAINPRTKELARQSRRAQNEVLSTVNVCVRVDKAGQPVIDGKRNDTSAVQTIREENSLGLLLDTADWCAFCLAELSLVSLRHRLQTFSFYNNASLLEIMKTEWKHLGPRGFLLPGALATCIFRWAEYDRPRRLRNLYNRITRHFIWPIDSRSRRKQLKIAIDIMERL